MERLHGVLGNEPLYAIGAPDGRARRSGADADGAGDIEIFFSDLAAHPYEALVEATVGVLATVPGVVEVWQEDRELILVKAPGVPPERLADVMDAFWLDALRRLPAPPRDVEPARPAGLTIRRTPRGTTLRDVVALPPSRRRMWTYFGFGAVAVAGGAGYAVVPGGSNGLVPLALGLVNLGVGLRMAQRRRSTNG